jgi:hypothetical protein
MANNKLSKLMIHFTKYAEKKFDILNKYKVFYTKEQIEDVVKTPMKTGEKDKYLYALKDGIKVIYKEEDEMMKVLTFFPVKK